MFLWFRLQPVRLEKTCASSGADRLFPLQNFPRLVATCLGWHTPKRGGTASLTWSQCKKPVLVAFFNTCCNVPQTHDLKKRVGITSHLLLRRQACTHLHLSPSWPGLPAELRLMLTPGARGDRCVSVPVWTEPFAGWGGRRQLGTRRDAAKLCSPRVFVTGAFEQVVPRLASLS